METGQGCCREGHDVAQTWAVGRDTQPASEPPPRWLSCALSSFCSHGGAVNSVPSARGALTAGPQPDLHWWFIDLIKQGLSTVPPPQCEPGQGLGRHSKGSWLALKSLGGRGDQPASGTAVLVTFVPPFLSDPIGRGTGSVRDSLSKLRAPARARGPQWTVGSGSPGASSPDPTSAAPPRCPRLRGGCSFALHSGASSGGLWRALCAHSCLAAPDAIVDQAFAVSA